MIEKRARRGDGKMNKELEQRRKEGGWRNAQIKLLKDGTYTTSHHIHTEVHIEVMVMPT